MGKKPEQDIPEVMKNCPICGMDIWALPKDIDFAVQVHIRLAHPDA